MGLGCPHGSPVSQELVVDVTCLLDQGVFDVYLGLTASGYELASPSRAQAVTEAILAGD